MNLLQILFLLQEAKPEPSVFEKYIWVVLLLLITNGITYYLNKPKTESEIMKNLNDVIKVNLEIIEKFQKTNEDLFSKFTVLQNDSITKSDKLKELQDLLEASEAQLNDCLSNCAPYDNCIETFESTIELLEQVKILIQGSAEAVPLIAKMESLTEKIQTIKGAN